MCGTVAQLCESHILPEWMYKFYYDNHHRYHLHKPKRAENGAVELDDTSLHQKGLKEYLLCQSCEGFLSEAERYFREVVHLNTGQQNTLSDNGLQIFGLDYKKVRTFILSILWRMSISSLPEFSGVSLGASEEKRIQEGLRHRDVTDIDDFSCAVAIVIPNDGSVTPMVGPTIRSAKNGDQVCLILAHACLFTYVIKGDDQLVKNDAIRKDGTMILRLASFESIFPDLTWMLQTNEQ